MGKFITVFENRCDEPFRTFKDGCCGTVRTNEAGGDKFVLLIENKQKEILKKIYKRLLQIIW